MGLLSFLKRNTDQAAKAPAAAAPDAVAAARTRARRRLIGAAVLLGVGVIGFPLLFETQPRPIPVNIPIEIPRRDAVPPLVLPPPPLAAAASAPADETPAPAKTTAAAPAEIVERAAEPANEPPAPAAAAKVAPPAAPTAAAAPKSADDGARARALLEGRANAKGSKDSKAEPKAAADTGVRLVVQVGAYTEAAKVREARQKLEKLGFKTYTQDIAAGGSKHTRVRVGPFDSRADADQAAARIKASGLPVAVLTL